MKSLWRRCAAVLFCLLLNLPAHAQVEPIRFPQAHVKIHALDWTASKLIAQAAQIPDWPTAFVPSGTTPFSIAYQTNTTYALASCTTVSTVTTCAFTSQPVGTAGLTRIVDVGILIRPTTYVDTLTSVTICGVAGTEATGAYAVTTTNLVSDNWYAPVATGTSCTITVVMGNGGAAPTRTTIGIWAVYGTSAAFSTANSASGSTNKSTISTSVTVPSGGGAIVVANKDTNPTANTVSNFTQDFGGPIEGSQWPVGGHDTSNSGSTTYGVTWTGGTPQNVIISVASFSP